MPSSNTKLNVWNLAIDIIRDTPLQTTSDPAATARWMDRNWQHTVETTLRAYPWNFAKEQHKLPADSTRPLFKWDYFYSPPAGWLRVLPITHDGTRFGRPIAYEIIGQRIAASYGPPLPVTLIMDKTANPGEWDALFTEIVRCKLALGLATKFPTKSKYIELADQMLQRAQQQAELIDAYEGTPEPVEQFDIERVRGAGTLYLPTR